MNQIKYYEDVALSNNDICKLIDGKANIIIYPDLHKYENIDQLLEPHGACILLFEAKKNYGHWCCLFKQKPNLLEFFNPYGGYPDDSLKYIGTDFRIKSNQDYPYLSKLMIDSPYNLSYNEYAFQKHKPDIKTCGRHCSLRIICRDMPINEYYNFINYYSKKLNLDNDGFVTLLTIKI